jgi:hypothetical protein
MTNILNFNKVQSIGDVIKKETGCEQYIVVAIKEGELHTYISDTVVDIDLVYAIQTLKDRRFMRMREVNEW